MTPALRHVTKISSLSPKEIKGVLKLALEMKARAGVLCRAVEESMTRQRTCQHAGSTAICRVRFGLLLMLHRQGIRRPICPRWQHVPGLFAVPLGRCDAPIADWLQQAQQ